MDEPECATCRYEHDTLVSVWLENYKKVIIEIEKSAKSDDAANIQLTTKKFLTEATLKSLFNSYTINPYCNHIKRIKPIPYDE